MRQKTYKELFLVGDFVEVSQTPDVHNSAAKWARGKVVKVNTRLYVEYLRSYVVNAYPRSWYNRGLIRRIVP